MPGSADDDHAPCLRSQGSASVLSVVVTPNAPRTRADGLHDRCLRVRLAAPPVDGKANAALQAWLAEALGLPRRDVQLLHGQTARRKQLLIELPLPAVWDWLQRQLAAQPGVDALAGRAGGDGVPDQPDTNAHSGRPGSGGKAGAAAL